MKEFPDKYFDLAVVDPPYGDCGGAVEERKPVRAKVRQVQNDSSVSMVEARTRRTRGTNTCCRTGGTWAQKYAKKIITWDTAPPKEYFNELFRVSRNQIIWGGNYFGLPPTRCFLIWKKLTISETFSMAMCEYAWTSLDGNAKLFECAPQGKNGERFHPTQKPVKLYEWILNKYAKPGDIILDTHVGSASSLVACRRTGHKYVGFEIDEYYYKLAKKRLDAEEAQANIFDYLGGTE